MADMFRAPSGAMLMEAHAWKHVMHERHWQEYINMPHGEAQATSFSMYQEEQYILYLDGNSDDFLIEDEAA